MPDESACQLPTTARSLSDEDVSCPTSTTAVVASRCRVKIVNHIDNSTAIVESPRDPYSLIFELAKMVKSINRRRDETLKASLHLLPDGSITLHWHCPHYCGEEMAREILEVAEPYWQVERAIRGWATT